MSHEPLTYHPLPEDPCLTEAQLCGYIDGTLTPQEQHKAERHLLDCNMCSDALEGFMLVKNRDKAAFVPVLPGEEKAKSGNAEQQEEKKEKGKVFFLFGSRNSRYAAAAALLLFVGVAWFMKGLVSPDEEKALSDNKAPASESIAHDSTSAAHDSMVSTDGDKLAFTPPPPPPPPAEEMAAENRSADFYASSEAARSGSDIAPVTDLEDLRQEENDFVADKVAPSKEQANSDELKKTEGAKNEGGRKDDGKDSDGTFAGGKYDQQTVNQQKRLEAEKKAEKQKLAADKKQSGQLFERENRYRAKLNKAQEKSPSYGYVSPAPKADTTKANLGVAGETYKATTDSVAISNTIATGSSVQLVAPGDVSTVNFSSNTAPVQNSAGAATYTWSPAGTTSGGSSAVDTKVKESAEYTVTVTDANGASAVDQTVTKTPARTYEEGLEMSKGNRNTEAIAVFDAILADPKNPKHEDAQWQKAVALVKLNRKAEAKTLLQTIIKRNGKYKALAESQLKQL